MDNCFDVARSTTAVRGNEYQDILRIGSKKIPKLQFRMDPFLTSTTPVNREVGGVLSIGRNSRVMAGRKIRFQERLDGNGVEVSEVFESEMEGYSHEPSSIFGYGRRWRFQSELKINRINICDTVRYDPGELDLLLPRVTRYYIEERLGFHVDEDETRVMIDCSRRLSVSLSVAHRRVTIPRSLLDVPGGREGNMCALRIRFVQRIDHCVIGRMLTRIFGNVVLDYRLDRVSFPPPRPIADITSPPIVEPLIPVFGRPVVGSSGREVILRRVDGGTGLIPLNSNPEAFMGYTLMKVGRGFRATSTGNNHGMVLASGDALRVEFSEQEIRIVSQQFVSVAERSQFVVVYTQLTGPRHAWDLPPSRRYGDEEQQPCPICHEDYVKNDEVVQLEPCGHIFHCLCVGEWLNGFGDSCPCCRVKIPS